MDRIPMTKAGYERLKEELRRLRSEERGRNIKDLEEARAHGDLKENAEYHAARERQGMIAAQILDLDTKISRAEVIDPKSIAGQDKIVFGATVTLVDSDSGDESTYQIVGDVETDVKQNKIGISSPIARGILGKREGDEVKIQTPRGARLLEIVAVVYE